MSRFFVGLSHAGAHLRKVRLLLFLLAFGLLLVRLEHDDGAVGIVDEMLAQQVLEIALAAGDAGLDGGQRLCEGKRGQRIAPVQP